MRRTKVRHHGRATREGWRCALSSRRNCRWDVGIASQITDLIEAGETLQLGLNTSRIDRWTFAGLLLSSNSRKLVPQG